LKVLIHAIENFVFFNTILTLVGFFAAYLLKSNANRLRLKPYLLARFFSLAIILPTILSAWLVAAVFLPESLLQQDVFQTAHTSPLHELHLLGDLTAKLEPFLAYLTFVFVASAVSFAVISTVRSYFRVENIVKKLEMNAPVPPPEKIDLVETIAANHQIEVGLVMSRFPFSFVWGFNRSKLLLSSGLLCLLNEAEIEGVLEHEAAHHYRRDNLAKLLLNFACYTSLAFSLSRMILKWRAAEVEMICDEVATARTCFPLEIADALVKLRRQCLTLEPGFSTKATSAFVPEDVPSLERRVFRLLTFADAPPNLSKVLGMSRPRRNDKLILVAVFTITLTGIIVFQPLVIHQLAEALVQFFG